MTNLLTPLLALSVLVLASCTNDTPVVAGSPAFPLDSVRSVIAATNTRYGSLFANNDSAAFVDIYTKDGCIFAPNMARICGRQGVGMFFRGGYNMGIRNIVLRSEEVVGSKEIVTEVGTYELKAADGAMIDKGKYIVLWKEEGGVFKMHRDQFNSDLPVPGTK